MKQTIVKYFPKSTSILNLCVTVAVTNKLPLKSYSTGVCDRVTDIDVFSYIFFIFLTLFNIENKIRNNSHIPSQP